MKIKTLFFVVAAMVIAASCQKASIDKNVVKGNGKVVFDITVVDGSTKSVKSQWANGDQIVCFFSGDATLGHQLRLTFDGTKWNAALDDPTFESSLVGLSVKKLTAVHWDGDMSFETSGNTIKSSATTLAGKTMLLKKDIDFTAEQSGESIIFTATIALERYTNFQIVLTDVAKTQAGEWVLSTREESKGEAEKKYGGKLSVPDSFVFDATEGAQVNNTTEDKCEGIENNDGVAFVCRLENLNSDTPLFFDNIVAANGKYFKIIPEGMNVDAAFKTTKASCWEITDTTDYVCDADYHYYRTVKLKDSNWWMADNMRLVPSGLTPSNDLMNVRAGIYYPVVSNGSAVVFSTDASVIGKRGYLYQSETALGVAVGSLQTQAAAEALAGAQGICPTGWHIPTINEITGLVGKAVSPIETKTDAPYYNGTNGSIVLLNQDKFNVDAYGAVSIIDATKTAATFMISKGYESKTASGFFMGSSFAGINMQAAPNADKVKNIQFYGFMPMTNKATEADYTCNGSKLGYLIGASVRCVKDKKLD